MTAFGGIFGRQLLGFECFLFRDIYLSAVALQARFTTACNPFDVDPYPFPTSCRLMSLFFVFGSVRKTTITLLIFIFKFGMAIRSDGQIWLVVDNGLDGVIFYSCVRDRNGNKST